MIAALLVVLAVGPPPEGSKKAEYLASKSSSGAARSPAPPRATEVLYARNLHTHEVMPLAGITIESDAYDRLLRCWFTEAEVNLPRKLIGLIADAAAAFGAKQVHIISGYRHPKYNKLLRKKGREVALKSHHTKGEAIDFSLVGVPTRDLYRYMLREHDGGVGYYGGSAFIHIDTGRKRTWRGR